MFLKKKRKFILWFLVILTVLSVIDIKKIIASSVGMKVYSRDRVIKKDVDNDGIEEVAIDKDGDPNNGFEIFFLILTVHL